ncbi:uncharacterized protein LOC121057155 isoform X2 [Cygnus olor]|uniref:uncharacterized protein LOC121057155 isoform X2 n=1 Tax=Cygnus olor TaxID=8869 RepID=UPI001ADE9BE5|nr:uncharacterized protein LOC121057155 isoform X2 [Cygnus olor]
MNSPTLDFITGSLKLFHVNKRIGRDVNLLHLFSFVPTPLCPPCVSMLDGTGRHNTTESEESWDLYKALRKAWPGNLQVAALSLLSSLPSRPRRKCSGRDELLFWGETPWPTLSESLCNISNYHHCYIGP